MPETTRLKIKQIETFTGSLIMSRRRELKQVKCFLQTRDNQIFLANPQTLILVSAAQFYLSTTKITLNYLIK